MEEGKIKFAWAQVNNPWQNTANANHNTNHAAIIIAIGSIHFVKLARE